MKVALAHDWLTGMRGGEKILEALCRIFPAADLYTLVHVKGSVSPLIEDRRVVTSPLQKFPGAERFYRQYLPLMPWAVERFDFSGYDLVVSSSHCVVKGLRPARAAHVCYCHTPMRYIWDQYDSYFGPGKASPPVRAAMALLRKPLQRWDARTSARVRAFIANSRHVAGRIKKFYGRESVVIHPPVDLDRFEASTRDDGFYLIVSALVPYKRVDLAVDAFNRWGRPLKIIGKGPEEGRLRRNAARNVEFLGWRSDESVKSYYESCRALVFPGEEDFGIVPLEAMACGKPAIAFGRGGALDTVVPLKEGVALGDAATGVFFDEPTADSLIAALDYFEPRRERFPPPRLREHARAFDRPLFDEKLRRAVLAAVEGREP